MPGAWGAPFNRSNLYPAGAEDSLKKGGNFGTDYNATSRAEYEAFSHVGNSAPSRFLSMQI